jgi:ribosomal protein S18 acetylase RimI-like enzyme
MVELRPAWLADATALASLHIQAWRDAYTGLMPGTFLDALDPEQREAGWRKTLTDPAPGVATLCAWHGQTLMGFVGCGPARGDMLGTRGEIYAINIPKSQWRQGVGRALMSAAAAHLVAQGNRDVALWVLEGNANARAFYRRLGGVETGVCDARDFGGTLLREIAIKWPDIGVLSPAKSSD